RSPAAQAEFLAPVEVELLVIVVVVVVVVVLVVALVVGVEPGSATVSGRTPVGAGFDERGSRPVVEVLVLAHAAVERGPDLGQQRLADTRRIGKFDVDDLATHPGRFWRSEVPDRPDERLVVARVRARAR